MRVDHIDWRDATAVHEVGHTLIRVLWGATLSKVEIRKNLFGSQYSGETCWDLPRDAWGKLSNDDIKAYCLGCIAGQEAESLWLCEVYDIPLSEGRDLTRVGSSGDLRNFRSTSQLVYGDFSLAGARVEVDQILLRHWKTVQLLAFILSERYKLSHRQAARQIRPGSDRAIKVAGSG